MGMLFYDKLQVSGHDIIPSAVISCVQAAAACGAATTAASSSPSSVGMGPVRRTGQLA